MNYSKRMSYNEFFGQVMKWMMVGIGITTITSAFISLTPLTLLLAPFYFPLVIVCSLIEIIMVLSISSKVNKLSFEKGKNLFFIYSAINGITISFLFEIAGLGISTLAFLMTYVYFGLLYTITKHTEYEFIGIGKICLAALPVLIIAYIILIFVNAPTLYYAVVFVDLAVFTGLTLYDIKKVRRIYEISEVHALDSMALICALELYLDFINILLDIIKLINDK